MLKELKAMIEEFKDAPEIIENRKDIGKYVFRMSRPPKTGISKDVRIIVWSENKDYEFNYLFTEDIDEFLTHLQKTLTKSIKLNK